MEKLVYVLFGSEPPNPAPLAAALAAHGARRVAVNVSDEHVAAKQGSRITRLDPSLAAVVTFWLERADRLGSSARSERLRSAGRLLGIESVPRPNTLASHQSGRPASSRASAKARGTYAPGNGSKSTAASR
jgi:hypothetical protein